MRELITGDLKELRSQMNQRTEEQMPPVIPPPPGTVRFVDVLVYDIPAEDYSEGSFSAGSSLEEAEEERAEEPPAQDGNEGEPPLETHETTEKGDWTRMRLHPFPVLLAILCVVFAGSIGVVYVLPLLAPSATVMIIPNSMHVTTTATISVVTEAATALPDQLQGRALSSVTMSQAQTIPATGVGHQDARAARGRITLYNAAPYEQIVLAGTLITAADGAQVVTDQDAVIPPAVFPTDGQVAVTAHAVIGGPTGNIKAGDIDGQCCRLNVFAVNGAFSGGQDARTYRMATEPDITRVASSLATNLEQGVRAALQTQVHADETLITPLPCQQKVTPDHAAGDEATQVRVTVDETCTGEVYNTYAYHNLVKHILSQQAMKQLGEGYSLSGDIQATISTATTKGQGMVELEVSSTGIWIFQFSQEQLQRLGAMIAGKNETQAKAALLGVPGVQSASITLRNTTTIPTDTRNIHLIFLVGDLMSV